LIARLPILGTRNALALGMKRLVPFGRTRSGRSQHGECEIIAALREGDSETLGEVYRDHREATHAVAARMILDASTAEDITQEAFLILPGALRGFRGGCSLRTFIIAIAVNLARHHERASFRRRHGMARYAKAPEIRAVLSPEQLMLQRQLGAAILQALAKLPTEKQTAFLLCEHFGHSSVEIAHLTRIPAATVRTRVHKARLSLREALSSEGYMISA
jgi:RNA polymerase sigma-70 factor, ECF subfamily